MKHLNNILSGIASLEYQSPADCVELRLYLLSLLQEFARQYQQIQHKQKNTLVRAYRELKNLYKNFTAFTAEKADTYKAQFEFAKALIVDEAERTATALQMQSMAVA